MSNAKLALAAAASSAGALRAAVAASVSVDDAAAAANAAASAATTATKLEHAAAASAQAVAAADGEDSANAKAAHEAAEEAKRLADRACRNQTLADRVLCSIGMAESAVEQLHPCPWPKCPYVATNTTQADAATSGESRLLRHITAKHKDQPIPQQSVSPSLRDLILDARPRALVELGQRAHMADGDAHQECSVVELPRGVNVSLLIPELLPRGWCSHKRFLAERVMGSAEQKHMIEEWVWLYAQDRHHSLLPGEDEQVRSAMCWVLGNLQSCSSCVRNSHDKYHVAGGQAALRS